MFIQASSSPKNCGPHDDKKKDEPDSHHQPEAPEQDDHVGPILAGDLFESRDPALQGMGNKEAEAVGNGYFKEVPLLLHVRESDHCKGCTSPDIGVPVRLEGRQFGFLMVKYLAAARVAEEDLERGKD